MLHKEEGPRLFDRVPWLSTSNSFLAEQYAQIIRKTMARGETCVILELGASHGKFSFLVLQHLMAQEDLPPFLYVISDVSRLNVEYCMHHPRLKTFVEQGIVDFAVFDALSDQNITLIRSGTVLSSCARLVVISNYLFSCLPHDAFRCVPLKDRTDVYESLVVCRSTQSKEIDKYDPELLSRIVLSWSYRLVSQKKLESYYTGKYAALSKILTPAISAYASLGACSFTVPVGAVNCLDRLQRIARGNLVLLCADKGYLTPEELLGLRDPHIAVHSSFSCMVNLDLIAKYWKSKWSGTTLHTRYSNGLKVALFGPSNILGASCVELFHSGIGKFGPEETFSFQKLIKEEIPNPSLKLIMSLLRLTCFDSDVFLKYKDNLLQHTSQKLSLKVVNDLICDLEQVCKFQYQVSPQKNVLLEVGSIAFALQRHEFASNLAQQVLESKTSPQVRSRALLLLANCDNEQGNIESAKQHVSSALLADPNSSEAKALLIQLDQRTLEDFKA